MQEILPPGTQTNFRSIATNEFLQVKGSNGTIYAIGDAATIEQDKALDRVGDLFDRCAIHVKTRCSRGTWCSCGSRCSWGTRWTAVNEMLR
jgi:hypothetical protein